MHRVAVIATALAVVPALAGPAGAVIKAHRAVAANRSGGGTVIQPTRTIIHNPDGTTTIIVHPQRSYLDTGTEVSVGDRSFQDYMLPPGGDPGRPNWFNGPDTQGKGRYPLPGISDGFNPYTPF